MNLPLSSDYIDIHTHGGQSGEGIFVLENLMAHEERVPDDLPEQPCSYGIHPWNLLEENSDLLLNKLKAVTGSINLFAVGECGFDKLRGASPELQRKLFEEQAAIAEVIKKPVVIHCVRGWDELLASHKKLRPKMPWLIHGFRGNKEMAKQLIVKGFYLSFWFDYIIRPESAELIRSVPKNRIFLETDGADIEIRDIYNKVSADLNLPVEELRSVIWQNFTELFNKTAGLTG
jgi:TatD DNase family protein